ncbi:MAG: hypothetical protein KatS3mg051_2068 [Anaerolineae bacterium]|nr:MAG: hypothetical protein KatS3mg051_1696 [Anaerolineae bacterium]GIV82714.1 MAG: hypothetical protein KatS3mg051_2068 [Anaerolineae bacterium]
MTPIIIGWIATAVLIWATLAGSAAVERYIQRRQARRRYLARRRELEREAERQGRRLVKEARRIIREER